MYKTRLWLSVGYVHTSHA